MNKKGRVNPAERPGTAQNLSETDIQKGLTEQQVETARAAGYVNAKVEADTPTDREIIRSNVLTYFNLIFLVIAICLLLVGAFRDLTFLPLIIFNTSIGIFQELQSKRVLDKMNMLHAPVTTVIRDEKRRNIPSEELVRGDLILLKAGSQIPADAQVCEGEIQVNEALLTGEADEIAKRKGDALLSGTFVVSGQCRAVLTAVGRDSYISELTLEAKALHRGEQSEMIRSLSRIVRGVGIILIPLAGLLMYQQHIVNQQNMRESVTATVAAVLGMIPEGLYLLASVAMAVSVMRLAINQVLIHNMKSIETLARADVLCVDKTGTITDSSMVMREVVPLSGGDEKLQAGGAGEARMTASEISRILCKFALAQKPDNATMEALQVWAKDRQQNPHHDTGGAEIGENDRMEPAGVISFSPVYKYSAVCMKTTSESEEMRISAAEEKRENQKTWYILGAPEWVLRDSFGDWKELVNEKAALGCRVLVFAEYQGEAGGRLTDPVIPLALVLLENPVRESAPRTFRYFARQGVSVKVISGDNPVTASEAARRAKIPGAERYVDASLLTEKQLPEAVERYVVFGRVTPERKRELVRALQAQGHTVAMTGDGVNDVLALKDADCSIAMASGSDAAANAAQMVLLDSDFSRMPDIVAEGRRVVNNIERTASLFLVKNIFSLLMAVFSILAGMNYPLEPSQISLIGMFTIGTPAFFMSLEPNYRKIRGSFMKNVLYRALPAGVTDFLLISALVIVCQEFNIADAQLSTMCTILMSIVGLMVLYRIMKPLNRFRRLLWAVMAAGLILTMRVLPGLFAITPLERGSAMLLALFAVCAWPVLRAAGAVLGWLGSLGKILRYAFGR